MLMPVTYYDSTIMIYYLSTHTKMRLKKIACFVCMIIVIFVLIHVNLAIVLTCFVVVLTRFSRLLQCLAT